MRRKSWLLIFLGVIALHGGVFFLIKDHRVIPPEWLVDRSPPEPTFRHAEGRYTDGSGEKMVVKEYTVPAKLAETLPP